MPRTETGSGGRSTGSKVVAFLSRRWLPLLLIVVGVVFILQNRGTTSIQLFFAQILMPQWMAMLGVFLVGLIAGVLIARNRRSR